MPTAHAPSRREAPPGTRTFRRPAARRRSAAVTPLAFGSCSPALGPGLLAHLLVRTHLDLDAPVLLAALRCRVGRERHRLAEADRRDARRGDALPDQVATHGVGPLLRERLVVALGAAAVGVPLHDHVL